ncbi:MAG: hypothetical protein K0S82_71 [Gaiellaceae bacterium]|jgi:hypothetical protein|nr:hypothetical protein [Gaiellaceae bacterium]
MAKWDFPSEEQQERFLAEIADGKTRQEAAEIVGSSSTKFRTLMNSQKPEGLAFAARYLEVLEEVGKSPSPLAGRIREMEGVQLAHRALDEFIMRALDAERGKASPSGNRMLYQLSLLKVEDFKPLLEARTRHIHEGAVGIYQMPQIDTAKWSLEQHREFVALRKRLSELVALAQPDSAQPPRELPVGADDIEGEAVEIEDAAVA